MCANVCVCVCVVCVCAHLQALLAELQEKLDEMEVEIVTVVEERVHVEADIQPGFFLHLFCGFFRFVLNFCFFFV